MPDAMFYNFPTIIIGVIVFAVVAVAVIKLIRDKKMHKGGCLGGCAGCTMGCNRRDNGQEKPVNPDGSIKADY